MIVRGRPVRLAQCGGAAQLPLRSPLTEEIAAIVALVESAYRGPSSRLGWTTEADLLAGRRTDSEAVRDIILAGTGECSSLRRTVS